jgi:membrane-associated protease RseP (regulator of RpoE activity)
MNRNRILAAAVAFVLATGSVLCAQAEEKKTIRHTFIVRDGKVVEMDDAPFLGGKRGYIGVRTSALSPELREHFGVDRSTGVLVASVEKGSPAEKAGLEVGDIVTAVDGKTVDDGADLRRAVARGKSKQSIVATIDEREILPRELFSGDFLDSAKLEGLRAFANAPEWKGRVMMLGPDCDELRGRIKELENRLKELEKKIEK